MLYPREYRVELMSLFQLPTDFGFLRPLAVGILDCQTDETGKGAEIMVLEIIAHDQIVGEVLWVVDDIIEHLIKRGVADREVLGEHSECPGQFESESQHDHPLRNNFEGGVG